jgi:hypothetical protein
MLGTWTVTKVGPSGGAMPLYRLLQERAYDDQIVTAMGDAYERALVTLGLKDRTDPATLLVAEKTISIVEQGIRNSDEIYKGIIGSFERPRA